MYEVMSADEAIRLIRDGDCICVNSFVGIENPVELHEALYRRYQRMQSPSHLTMISSAGFGVWDENRNAEGYIREGAVDRLICGHFGAMLSTKKLVLEDRFEAYNLPLGCISHAIRAQAGGLPGALSKVGLDIFVDPRKEGPGINRLSIDDSLVKYVEVDGEEFLYYKLPKITVALIKGTAADRKGNISFDDMFMSGDALSICQAVKANHGRVIVQVDRLVDTPSRPRNAIIPGCLVDAIVVVEPEERNEAYTALTGSFEIPYAQWSAWNEKIDTVSAKTRGNSAAGNIIGRRAAKESWASQFDEALRSIADVASTYITQLASGLGAGIFPFISSFTSQLFIVFLGIVLAYWLALDYPRIHREIGIIVGGERETSYRFMVAILSRSVGGYMRSMVITSFVNGVLAFVGLAIVGHPYAALMGVLTGVMHLVPVLGSWISSFAATLLAVFYGPVLAIWTLVITMVAQNVTDNVISPKVMQSSVKIHPAMNLAALVVGSTLMGPLGMVIAIPLCAALKGLFVFYFEKETGRALVSYDGAIFQGTPYRDADGAPVPAFDALGDDSFVAESELISDDVAPTGEAVPRPAELENPWSKLAFLHRPSDK